MLTSAENSKSAIRAYYIGLNPKFLTQLSGENAVTRDRL